MFVFRTFTFWAGLSVNCSLAGTHCSSEIKGRVALIPLALASFWVLRYGPVQASISPKDPSRARNAKNIIDASETKCQLRSSHPTSTATRRHGTLCGILCGWALQKYSAGLFLFCRTGGPLGRTLSSGFSKMATPGVQGPGRTARGVGRRLVDFKSNPSVPSAKQGDLLGASTIHPKVPQEPVPNNLIQYRKH